VSLKVVWVEEDLFEIFDMKSVVLNGDAQGFAACIPQVVLLEATATRQ